LEEAFASILRVEHLKMEARFSETPELPDYVASSISLNLLFLGFQGNVLQFHKK
jgi:hypothetical protein